MSSHKREHLCHPLYGIWTIPEEGMEGQVCDLEQTPRYKMVSEQCKSDQQSIHRQDLLKSESVNSLSFKGRGL